MSELKLRQFPINYSFDWEYGVSISKIREDLDALEELGASHIIIDTSTSDDCSYLIIEAVGERLETQEEYDRRIAEKQARENSFKDGELAELQRLKEKYE